MMYDDEETVDVVDWKGNRLIVGQVYYEFDDWVHEDERWEYVEDIYRKITIEEGMQ